MGQAIMIQGTGSNVGKSALALAFCRIFARAGYKVAPFKAQNMGRSTSLTGSQGEISEIQALQAKAALREPTIEMNPILLKPIDEINCQVIVNGKSHGVMSAQEYIDYKANLIPVVAKSLSLLKEENDLVVIEGAGSPAEVNLREHDLVNMEVAKLAQAAVFLVANINLGGVFAYVHGTLKLLADWERDLVKGIILNQFSGKPENFIEGKLILEELTNLPVAGIIPYYTGLALNSEESIEAWANHVEDNVIKAHINNSCLGLGM